jgi:hypothetical protein
MVAREQIRDRQEAAAHRRLVRRVRKRRSAAYELLAPRPQRVPAH